MPHALILASGLFCLLLFSTPSEAAYQIRLTNGGSFTVKEYADKGDQVSFAPEPGVTVHLSKADIAEIRKFLTEEERAEEQRAKAEEQRYEEARRYARLMDQRQREKEAREAHQKREAERKWRETMTVGQKLGIPFGPLAHAMAEAQKAQLAREQRAQAAPKVVSAPSAPPTPRLTVQYGGGTIVCPEILHIFPNDSLNMSMTKKLCQREWERQVTRENVERTIRSLDR